MFGPSNCRGEHGWADEAFGCRCAEMLSEMLARSLDHGSLGLVGAYLEIISMKVRAGKEKGRGLRPEPRSDRDTGAVPASSEPEWSRSPAGQPSGWWAAGRGLWLEVR